MSKKELILSDLWPATSKPWFCQERASTPKNMFFGNTAGAVYLGLLPSPVRALPNLISWLLGSNLQFLVSAVSENSHPSERGSQILFTWIGLDYTVRWFPHPPPPPASWTVLLYSRVMTLSPLTLGHNLYCLFYWWWGSQLVCMIPHIVFYDKWMPFLKHLGPCYSKRYVASEDRRASIRCCY